MIIGLGLVNGGGGWDSCGDFFSFFLLGDGGEEEGGGVRTIPSYLPLLSRHHGRTATESTCMDTSYGRDPVTTAPDLG